MNDLAHIQAYNFFIYVLSGLIIGIFFDLFRAYRRTFKTSDFITYIHDIIFWLVTVFFLLFVNFKLNNGELRGYVFFGIFIGALLYILAFSKYFIKISVKILTFLKNIFIKLIGIVFIPIRIIKKCAIKPVLFMFINLKNVKTKIKNSIVKKINTKRRIL